SGTNDPISARIYQLSFKHQSIEENLVFALFYIRSHSVFQFFPRPQMQAARPSIPNNSPSMRPGAQTATAAVYQPSQGPIIMMNPPVPYPQAPQAQYYIFRPSAAPYVGPPQQYSVQPPPGPFYSGPGPGDFPAYAPSYYSQPVYSPSAPLIVPTQQPPPPTKREKKTIRIRDPNQGGKDITEEIMSGGGGSRNPTPPVVRPSSTPTPPQVPCMPDIFLSQSHTTNGCCFLTDEKPKQEAVVKSTSPGIREEEVIEKKETEEEPPDFAPLETEETSAPSDSVFPASDSTDETAPSLPKEEEESAPNLVLHPEIDDSSEKEQVDTDLPEEVLVSPEAVTNTDVNGIEEREVSVSPLESIAQELPPSPTEGEVADTSVSDAQEEEVQDKESAEVEEKEVDENESQHLNSRKSPEPVPGRFTMNRKRAFSFGQPATLLFYFEHVFWVLAEQWKPLNPEGKKRYDREFLLGFQFIPASIQKPEGLPAITDVVLDKVNQTKSISRPLDPSRMLTRGPDFTPSYADFGRPVLSTRVIPVSYFKPRKIIPIVSVNDDVKLKKSENAWKPTGKREAVQEEPDLNKTQDLFRRVRSILNKLTPQMFQQLMKQVQELTIDTEERLKGVINLVFEKAIDEPNFSVAYANMCRCLTMLKVPMADKPGAWVNFRKLLLNRCQKEFEKDKAEDIFNEKRQKEIDASSNEEKSRLQAELKETKDMARRRSIGNIKFIGELFKLKMLTEAIMHDCVVKLLKNHDQESLECLCRLLTTIGKDLDFEKAKPRMDQYFNQMEKIVKERKTSSRIRFMLQDVIDLRQKNWVARRVEQGPKTIEQIHKDAQIEEQQQQLKVHQQLLSKQEKRRPAAVRPSEEAWNVVPVGKSSRTIDPMKPDLPPSGDSPKSAFSEDEMEKKSKSIIDEFLHITDYKEAVQCVEELNSLSLLHVFVRVGVESTLERSQITREHMGQLFYQLVQSGKLPKEEFFKGFLELLELAEDMAIDIPHIWLYLGELVTPMLQESGISMRELFTEFSKPLLPVERAGVLLSEVLHLLCKQMSHKKVGALWKETELNWKDFLPEGEDVQNFISEKKLEFTVSDASSPTEALSKQELSAEELNKWLEKLIIEDKASNEQIFDWVEANLDESQIGSSTFLRALMTTVCRSAITGEGPPSRVDANIIQQRLRLLLKYLNSDTERELQALYALQALIVKLDQPPNLLRMFFDTLYDEDVISEDAFYKWESSKDPAEQNGKGVALKSVTAFFTWLREAEEESEDN
uniref:Eukaryotic translation initiation factor 4 gamma, 3b n=1 Tax=Callorhinchus milii TaxID=7868 RepID=A0A4W3H324_CALMI